MRLFLCFVGAVIASVVIGGLVLPREASAQDRTLTLFGRVEREYVPDGHAELAFNFYDKDTKVLAYRSVSTAVVKDGSYTACLRADDLIEGKEYYVLATLPAEVPESFQESQGQPLGIVLLQASTPGIQQTGHVNISGTLIAGVIKTSAFQMSTGATSGHVLTSDASGNGTWQALPPPSGAAGGDLSGTYPNPLVDGLQGWAVASTAPTTGQVLKWTGSAWSPAVDNDTTYSAGAGLLLSGTTFSIAPGGVVTNMLADLAVTTAKVADQSVTSAKIADGAVTDAKLSNTGVGAGTYGSATQAAQITVNAQGRITAASDVTISGVVPGGTAGGDLSGTYPNPLVDGLQGFAVASTAPTSGQVLKWTGSAWSPAVDDDTTYSAGAGLLLSGTTFSIAPGGVATNMLADLAVTTAKVADLSVTSAKIADGAVTDAKLSNTGVGAGTYGSATQAAQITVNAQGRITAASDVTISGVVPGGTAGGDLSGTYPSPLVAGLQNRPVASTAPTTGQVLKWDGSAWSPDADLRDQFWQATANNIFYNAGNVGIGTSSPAYPLHVVTGTGDRAIYGLHTATSGTTYGVYGQSASSSGLGVYGFATATSGTTYGGRFESDSTSGTGVLGFATATSGNTTGGWFVSASSSGRGVMGYATATSGDTTGVYGQSDSTSGRGVYGLASATSGTTYGVSGSSWSTSGTGVFGEASATSGTTYGVYGLSASTAGYGVYGLATASSGIAYGVYGQSASTSGRGVYGSAAATSGTTYGVYGLSASTSGYGVYGLATATSGTTYGGRFESDSTSGRGVYGSATATSGTTYGVYGLSASTSGYGVYGLATASSGTAYGVYGQSASTSARAVMGYATATSGSTTGVWGLSASTDGRGVYGVAAATGGTNYGVYGLSQSALGTGVFGVASAASGTNYGVLGQSNSTSGYGVYATGNFGASGTKSFQIDHPLSPETHYLNHFCTEGPEPLNAYSENVVTDARGYATVRLPDYFESINREYRYQLTVIDDSDDFVLAKVVREIQNNQFVIRTNKPGVKVSWEVKAVRNDRWVQEYGFETEQEKPKEHLGKYLHPELYGIPKEYGIHYHPEPEREKMSSTRAEGRRVVAEKRR